MAKQQGWKTSEYTLPGGILMTAEIKGANVSIIGMDIPAGVKEAEFSVAPIAGAEEGGHVQGRVKLKEADQPFLDVEEITIGENITDIEIPNALFPNVKKVHSRTTRFLDGVPFIAKRSLFETVLLNAFIHDGGTMPLRKIKEIAPAAFAGCSNLVLTDTQDVQSVPVGSIPESMLVEEDGAMMAGTILVKAKFAAEYVRVPDRTTYIAQMAFSWATIKTLEIGNVGYKVAAGLLENLPYGIENLKICFDDAKFLSAAIEAAHCGTIKSIGLPENKLGYESIDGIIYGRHGIAKKELICCPAGKAGHVDVAPGTVKICSHAFCGGKVTGVSLPESLNEIGEAAFVACSLREVTLPPALGYVGGYNFKNIERVHIPGGKPIPGLLESCIRYSQQEDGEGGSDGLQPYILFDMAGFEFAVPRTVIDEDIKTFSSIYDWCVGAYASRHNSFHDFRDAWNAGIFKEKLAGQLYTSAATDIIMQETAFMEYRLRPENEKAKKRVKENAKQIAARRVADGDAKGLSEILKIGGIGKEGLEGLFGMAGDGTMRAYILAALENAGRGKENFVL